MARARETKLLMAIGRLMSPGYPARNKLVDLTLNGVWACAFCSPLALVILVTYPLPANFFGGVGKMGLLAILKIIEYWEADCVSILYNS